METKWKSPKIITGPVATGDYYYHRAEIVSEIWEELEKGCFILMAAPRRVGKTSIMRYIQNNPKENYKVIFQSIQSLTSEEEFYKAIYALILSCLSTSNKLKNYFQTYLKTKSITEVNISGGFKISNTSINYLNEINKIISDINEIGETIVLLIDELPEVLHRLNKNGKKEEAISILKNLRTWRQDEKFKNLKFVLAGSIGIHYVVNAIEGRNSDLNDLKKIQCNTLDKDEINKYIDWATKDATIQYSNELRDYLLEKIKYFVPYFFNIMFDTINNTARKEKNQTMTKSSIDNAFNLVIKNNEYFSDWKNRLSEYLPKEDFKYVNNILTHIAHKDNITIQEIYNKASEYNKNDVYMDLINELEHDGYIIEENKKYIFISPFLKEFWKHNNPNYNG